MLANSHAFIDLQKTGQETDLMTVNLHRTQIKTRLHPTKAQCWPTQFIIQRFHNKHKRCPLKYMVGSDQKQVCPHNTNITHTYLSVTVDRVSLIGLLFLAVIPSISYSHFQMHQEKHRFLMLHEAVASVYFVVLTRRGSLRKKQTKQNRNCIIKWYYKVHQNCN